MQNEKNGNGVDANLRSTSSVTGTWDARTFNYNSRAQFFRKLVQDGEQVRGTFDWRGPIINSAAVGIREVVGTYKGGKLYLYVPGTIIEVQADVAGDEIRGYLIGYSYSRFQGTRIH